MLREWIRILRIVALVVGVLLSFFAIIELIRAYHTLREVHPVVGYVFLGLLTCGVVWLGVWLGLSIAAHPSTLVPPSIKNRAQPSEKELRRYGKYLIKYIQRLSVNDNLPPEEKEVANRGLALLKNDMAGVSGVGRLHEAIEKAEENTIDPLLCILDEKADKHVRDSVRDIMLGVAISPYKGADLLIVIYKNAAMVVRTIRIYNSRPRFREQLRILRDVMWVVATVNYFNIGKNLLQGLLDKFPGGKFVDDIAEGVGAGMMTSVAGHAAQDRCRSFRGWNQVESKAGIRQNLSNFYKDVRKMMMEDLFRLPAIKNKFGKKFREKWDDTLEGVTSALEATRNKLDDYVTKPIQTGSKGLAKTGNGGLRLIKGGGRAAITGTVKLAGNVGKGAKFAGTGAGRGVLWLGKKTWGYSSVAGRVVKKRFQRKNRK